MLRLERLVFLVCLTLVTAAADAQENITGKSRQTDYVCANTVVELGCPAARVIVVTSVVYKYSPSQCTDYDAILIADEADKGSQPLDHCIGVDKNDEQLRHECNGHQNCTVFAQGKLHKMGHDGTNCDFNSNLVNIFYECIPNALSDKFKSFDICELDGPETILGVDRGFVHSPFYPNYYGNFNLCLLGIDVPAGQRLVIYLLSRSLEGLSFFHQRPKDYLQIGNDLEIYGQSFEPRVVYNGSDRHRVQLKFNSDWITMVTLAEPKGFLLYFELNPIEAPVIASTLPPTTKTPRPPPPITTTVESIELLEEMAMDAGLAVDKALDTMSVVSQQLVRKEADRQDSASSESLLVIFFLVALVGVLVIIIFGLLIAFRKRSGDMGDENMYEEKSIRYGGNYHNEEAYQNVSIASSSSVRDTTVSNDTTNDATTNGSSKNGNDVPVSPKSFSPSKFNKRLKSLYKHVNASIRNSRRAVKEANKVLISSEESKTETVQLSGHQPQQQADSASANMSAQQQQQQQQWGEENSTSRQLKAIACNQHAGKRVNRMENEYATNPVIFEQSNSCYAVDNASLSTSQSTATINTRLNIYDAKQLTIYEIEFEDNQLLIKHGVTANDESAAHNSDDSTSKSEVEIYQTINEVTTASSESTGSEYARLEEEEEEDNEVDTTQSSSSARQTANESALTAKEEAGNMCIYATPTNDRVVSSFNLSMTDANSSSVQLLPESH